MTLVLQIFGLIGVVLFFTLWVGDNPYRFKLVSWVTLSVTAVNFLIESSRVMKIVWLLSGVISVLNISNANRQIVKEEQERG